MNQQAPVTITDNAVKRVAFLLEREGKPGMNFRISVTGVGCSGFQYKFDLDDKIDKEDVMLEKGNVKVLIDSMSLLYMMGSEIDFIEDLSGSNFRISNPNAEAQCGCGTSFSV